MFNATAKDGKFSLLATEHHWVSIPYHTVSSNSRSLPIFPVSLWILCAPLLELCPFVPNLQTCRPRTLPLLFFNLLLSMDLKFICSVCLLPKVAKSDALHRIMKYLSFLPSFFSRLANKKTFSLRDLRGDGCPQTTAVVPGRSTAPYGDREDLWGFGHGTFRPAPLGCGPRAVDVKWRKSEVAWLESSYTVAWQVL